LLAVSGGSARTASDEGRPTAGTDENGERGIGELATRSHEFRSRWAAHNVRYHQTGIKRLHHPVVGELELSYEVMELSADTGLTMSIYTAEPGSRSQQALDLLSSWTASPDAIERRLSGESRKR
jgi:MmyB-like transcription regulator ligand binding domain